MSKFNFFKKRISPKAQTMPDDIENRRTIGNYILGDTLGMGGYSKVKLGYNSQTGEKVALKIMMADEQGNITTSQKKQLRRELSVMSNVKHTNVIRLIDFYPDEQYPERDGKTRPCIMTVLELASGGELFDFLMYSGHFDEVTTRTYFHQLMDGMNACHSAGIAHRDIKPENLLLDENYNLKIADFGFATVFRTPEGESIRMKTACGTRGYLAPELLLGQKYSHLCDIFACGIILFTLYAGFPPFQHAIATDWWWNKLETKNYQLFWLAHERTRKFPTPLKDLVVSMLAADPNERIDIPQIREHPWYNANVLGQTELKRQLHRRRRVVEKERRKKLLKTQKDSLVPGHGRKNRDIELVSPNGEKIVIPVNPNQMLDTNFVRKVYDDAFAQYYDTDVLPMARETITQGEVTDGCHVYDLLEKYTPEHVSARIRYIVTNRLHGNCTIYPEHNQILSKINVDVGSETYPVTILTKFFQVNDDRNNIRDVVMFKRFEGDPIKYSKVMDSVFMPNPELTYTLDLEDDDDDLQ